MKNLIKKEYQQLLKDIGLYDGQIDGLYGPKTKHAVMRFQTMNGLSADGVIGRKTEAEFENQLGSIKGRDNEIKDYDYGDEESTYFRWPQETTAKLNAFYGDVGTNQTKMELPYRMKLAWDTDITVDKITCHEKVADSLYTVLNNVKRIYSPNEIAKNGFDLFGGTLNVRNIRGGNRYSTHSWGCAIDIDPARNGLRLKWDKSYLGKPQCREFIDCFRDEGWFSLGYEKGYDSMHFQACWRP